MRGRMNDFSRRGLTRGEALLMRAAFGEALSPEGVQLLQMPRLAPWGAMVPLRDTIVHGAWRAPLDFDAVSLREQSWFIHELAHVWQARRGVVLAVAKLAAIGAAAYVVRADERPFAAFNIEQQAEIIRFAFLVRMGAPDPAGPDPAWLEARWPSRPGPLSA